jgi:hypothetical protein
VYGAHGCGPRVENVPEPKILDYLHRCQPVGDWFHVLKLTPQLDLEMHHWNFVMRNLLARNYEMEALEERCGVAESGAGLQSPLDSLPRLAKNLRYHRLGSGCRAARPHNMRQEKDPKGDSRSGSVD